MKSRKNLPVFDSVPKVPNPAFVIRIDLKKKKEELYIAPSKYIVPYLQEISEYNNIMPFKYRKIHSREEQQQYILELFNSRMPEEAPHYEQEIIYKSKQKLGSLLLDFLTLPESNFLDSEYRKVFLDVSPDNYTQCVLELNELFFLDNPVAKYLSVKLRDIYSEYELHKAEDLFFPIEAILNSFSELIQKNPTKLYMKLCSEKTENPLSAEWINAFLKYYPEAKSPVSSLLIPGQGNKLCFMTEGSLTPLIAQYINILATYNLKIRECQKCGQPFWIFGSEKSIVCSESCRKELHKDHRTAHNNKAIADGWKTLHYNHRQYWLNHIARIQKKGSVEALDEALVAYQKYKADSLIWRNDFVTETKEEKDHDSPEYMKHLKDFNQKHLNSRNIIDSIMLKHGLIT